MGTICHRLALAGIVLVLGFAPSHAAPLAAKDLAARLLAHGFVPKQDGYTVQQALACNPPGAGETYAVRCIAFFHDAQRGGLPAVVEIRLFDRDQTLAPLEQPLIDHIASLKQRWTMDIEPAIVLTKQSTGVQSKAPADCHQGLGAANTPAYCAVLFTPRIFITTGVRPTHAATTSLTIITKGTDPNEADTDHSRDLAVLVIGMIGSEL